MNFKESFHKWYYTSEVWKQTKYMGVSCQKCPFDLWNYQEIIYDYNIGLVVEFGVLHGGATKYFSDLMANISSDYAVVGFDINLDNVNPEILIRDNVQLYLQDTGSKDIQKILKDVKSKYNYPTLYILDSDHSMLHVYNELINIKNILKNGDYVVVEDTNLNGNPVLENFGKGPMEAIELFKKISLKFYSQMKKGIISLVLLLPQMLFLKHNHQ